MIKQLITRLITVIPNENPVSIEIRKLHRGTMITEILDESDDTHMIYTVYNENGLMVDKFIDIPCIVSYEHRKEFYGEE